MLEIGSRLPDFSLPDQHGKLTSSQELLGRGGPVVLYFYPKDDTPGCTVEACGFRDSYHDFLEAGATVVGVSRDDVDSHRKFAEQHQLPFTLLADAGGSLRERMGVPRTLGLLDGRATFVIDREGVVRHTFNSQIRAKRHVVEALDIVKRLAT
jgi:peroxiredoxin Q/BCP